VFAAAHDARREPGAGRSCCRGGSGSDDGEELPPDAFTIGYPPPDPDWDCSFDNEAEMRRRCPAPAGTPPLTSIRVHRFARNCAR
jgi:hypothetical protein